jgi:hypothetical protein
MTPIHRIALTAGLLAAATGLEGIVGAQTGKPSTDKPQADKPAAAAPKTPPAAARERDRWKIKTGSDAEAREIATAPVASTVEKLLAIPRPLDMPPDGSNSFFQQHRARPAETTVFSVEADVVDCRLMPDGDYRVTVQGVSGKKLVLEMPNPGPEFVDPKGKFAAQIKSAREQFETKFKPERKSKSAAGHARITGVGFFGRTYGNRAPDGNMIQLHPILKIEWLDKPTPDFTAPPDAPDKSLPAPKPTKSPGKPAKPQ